MPAHYSRRDAMRKPPRPLAPRSPPRRKRRRPGGCSATRWRRWARTKKPWPPISGSHRDRRARAWTWKWLWRESSASTASPTTGASAPSAYFPPTASAGRRFRRRKFGPPAMPPGILRGRIPRYTAARSRFTSRRLSAIPTIPPPTWSSEICCWIAITMRRRWKHIAPPSVSIPSSHRRFWASPAASTSITPPERSTPRAR